MSSTETATKAGAQSGSGETLIGCVKKNAAEQLRVTTGEFHGHDLVSLRLYFEQVTGSGEWLPTKKGVTFRRALLPEVIALLQKAQAEADGAQP